MSIGKSPLWNELWHEAQSLFSVTKTTLERRYERLRRLTVAESEKAIISEFSDHLDDLYISFLEEL